jgi:hypothetical protein
MNRERAHAYRRVMATLDELGPSKLHDDELELVRHAADTLIFSSELRDPATLEALRDIEALSRTLVESGRWEEARAMRLADDVSECGPALGIDQVAA